MVNWNIIISISLIVAFVGVILWISLPGLLQFAEDEANRELQSKVSQQEKMMCNSPEKMNAVFDNIDLISSENFDNKARGIYQTILWGNDIESCDISYLYNQLDDSQKEKLNWNKLECTINHCITK
jgi:hypothetical protein